MKFLVILKSPQNLIYETFNNFIMTIEEAEELCRMVNTYHPETREELRDLIEELIEERGNEADLNDIDVSRITDMDWMFSDSKFNGDISEWNVSRVESMEGMFYNSQFNGDISNWDVSSVKRLDNMFNDSEFNGEVISLNGMLVVLRV